MRITRTASRRKLFGALLCTLSVAACGPAPEGEPSGEKSPETGSQEHPVVYGPDNRTDVYAYPASVLRTRAEKSTVALMNPSDFNASNPNNVTFNGSTLQSAYNLCSTQRFLNDPTSAFCSGTLIDDDLVLTAGHCITSASACANTRFVFNFYRTSATTLQTVTTADIFSCQSIVARQQGTVGGRNLDFAVVRLDRPATPRFEPAPIRPGNTALPLNTGVSVIGSGSGIPFKIDDGGWVRDARAGTLDYFVANTDTFGGNSGSGVYENNNVTVAGILVRGVTDYVSQGGCNVVNQCTDTGCGGESITYVRPAIDAYCAVAGSMRLCGTTEPPPPPPVQTFTFSATNTNSAQQNTTNVSVTLAAGQTLSFGTCTLPQATGTGDTYLRLYNTATNTQVAANDDSCSLLSYVSFTAPAAGTYQMRVGCYSSGSCSGTVAYSIQ
ncbi:trypsin-like serine protease [Myxococcus sp. AB056]|uniref:trypsin-like serine protease n=1 Tax=Myxococcus sp. AB056 TaxID=2562792 RepID=UPI0011472FCD|nr:trypsin-like serine protease [Myxococcus sp. AB056]